MQPLCKPVLDHKDRQLVLETSPTSEADLDRLLQDILNFTSHTVEQWIQERHQVLQKQNLTNAAIFQTIEQELPFRRFAAPALSERQIRRIIYG